MLLSISRSQKSEVAWVPDNWPVDESVLSTSRSLFYTETVEVRVGLKNQAHGWVWEPTNPWACSSSRLEISPIPILESSTPKKPYLKPASSSALPLFLAQAETITLLCLSQKNLCEVCCAVWLCGIPWLLTARMPCPSELQHGNVRANRSQPTGFHV